MFIYLVLEFHVNSTHSLIYNRFVVANFSHNLNILDADTSLIINKMTFLIFYFGLVGW